MNPRRLSNPRMLAVVGAAMIALTACDGGTANTVTSASPTAPSTIPADSRAAWLDLAKCMRANGSPNFPDPVQNAGGVWALAPDVNEEIPAACDQLFRNAKQSTNAASGPSTEDMAKLRRYAACMREHGLRNFPDPDEDGNFGPQAQQPEDATYRTAHEACKQYAPPPRPK
jgi:hypothetical protein